MNGGRRVELAERKGLLTARAELDRARIMLAAHEIRTVVLPHSDGDRASRYRPVAAMLVGVLGPSVGASRVKTWLKVAWFALAALRVLRNWR
ncbi:MAG: hypothetical protein ABI724_11920 [Betaproteobacteria bacterium]